MCESARDCFVFACVRVCVYAALYRLLFWSLAYNVCIIIMCVQDLINGFSCSCSTGWTGDTCGEDIDECSELSPCKNGSTCSVGVHTAV